MRKHEIMKLSDDVAQMDFKSLLVQQQLDEKDKKIQELT